MGLKNRTFIAALQAQRELAESQSIHANCETHQSSREKSKSQVSRVMHQQRIRNLMHLL